MKSLEIVGNNPSREYDRIRRACRGIILDNGRILLSHGAAWDLWMIPGGGLEPGEDELDCCTREVAEETGYRIRPTECALETVEYIESKRLKHINHYYFAEVIGQGEKRLTEIEQKVAMEPEWLPIEEAISVFSGYDAYAGTNEMRYSLYLREYRVLCELFGKPGEAE